MIAEAASGFEMKGDSRLSMTQPGNWDAPRLLRCVSRVIGLFEELVLQPRAHRIRFDRSDCINQTCGIRLHIEFAKFFRCNCTNRRRSG